MRGTNGNAPSALVVDACVILKWLVVEVDEAPARRLLAAAEQGECALLAPDLWRIEVTNALWKRTRREDDVVRPDDAWSALAVAASLPVGTASSDGLIAEAFEVALQAGITVYDALYATLALRHHAPLVTADERLAHRLRERWPEFGVVMLSEL